MSQGQTVFFSASFDVLVTPVIIPNQWNLNVKEDDGIISIPRISSSKSDILCGVSNVIYRKEYDLFFQTSFTAYNLKIGIFITFMLLRRKNLDRGLVGVFVLLLIGVK